jgi:ribosomal-protein-alanine N-acetyltransferase
VIGTGRVRLRPVEERDYPLIHRWQQDPDVWWWMDHERAPSMIEVREEEGRAREEGHPFVIELDGRPVGKIGVNAVRRRDRIASLYVFIGERDEWAKGVGSEAILALLGWVFDHLDLHRVELWSLAGNARAIGAYERCGFEIDARLPERSWKEGRWHDRVVMSVTRERFEAARTAWAPLVGNQV